MGNQNALLQTLKIGNSGGTVTKLQEELNKRGYNLAVDGIFGENTLSAVKDFQKKQGIATDGIVGDITWGNLTNGSTNTGGSTNTSGSANKDFSYKDFSYKDFKYNDYKESDIVTQAKAALDAQLAQKPGEYNSQWQAQLDDTINKILNREKFSYDLNGDALYQQYKDKYTQQAKMAMGDAIGQASAMTGGYGNSYAQSVGQQMYAKEMQNLNDIVPELYAMAYDKYNQEGQDLYNQYAMLGAQEERDYGRHRDSLSDWLAERNYLAGRYDSERDYDYSKYVDDRNFDYGKYSDDRNLAYSEYSDDKTLAYNEHRNAIEDEQRQKEFEEAVRQFDANLAEQQRQFNLLNQEVQNSVKSYSGTAPSGGSYNNGGLTNGQVKELQAALGVTADGYYGDKSKKAAGGLSAAEAYAKYVGSIDDSKGGVVPDYIVDKVKNYSTEKGQADYLANEVNKGNIDREQAVEILNQYGVTDLVNRSWEMVDDGGINFLGIGIDADARVKDENGNEYSLAELRKELKKTMNNKQANAWIKDLEKQLGI